MPNGWTARFDDPIELPTGGNLHTLADAIAYLAKTVPAKERNHPAVTTASTILTQAAEGGVAWMFLARMPTLMAIHRNDLPEPFNPDRKTRTGASGS